MTKMKMITLPLIFQPLTWLALCFTVHTAENGDWISVNFPSENNSNMATKKFELLAKHVKSLQFVIAIAFWAVVIEKDQTNEKGLYSLLEKLYLGDVNDDDTIAMHE